MDFPYYVILTKTGIETITVAQSKE